ncbi:MAG TPA: GNAT family N-acetyltransferase, partial [Micromonosporaceae bacterium]|nr:GNAT family N-acetyltransferase [Micromonosporaceae bacterium]
VDPAYEGRGVGAHLLDWCLRTAAGRGAEVTVETESVNDAAERLFTSRGLTQVFSEVVMRFDLAGTEPPPARLPAGVELVEWSARHAPRFFAVYDAAFRERPGFPGWSERQWVDWVTEEGDLRPRWSLLADAGVSGDVGFVVCADCWVVQVGVRPDWRGRAVGAALVAEALRRMRAAGATEALLDVNVDNPARHLYPRLGFAVLGRRARFARTGT